MLTGLAGLLGGLVVLALWRAARQERTAARVRALTAPTRWRAPQRLREPLGRALADADLPITPEAAIEWTALAIGSVLVLVTATMPSLLVPVAVGLVAAGPVVLWMRRGVRAQRIAAALPVALHEVAAALRSGATVPQALEHLAGGTGPLAGDFTRIGTRVQLGAGLSHALDAWAGERESSDVRAAAGTLALASTLGGRAAGAIDGLAASLRQRLDARAETRSLSTQARVSAQVVGLAPLGYLGFSVMLDPGSVDLLVRDRVGRTCLAVGLACQAGAAWWMRRLVAGVER